MALWTLLDSRAAKRRRLGPPPTAPMDRTAFSACRDTIRRRAGTDAASAPTFARRMQSKLPAAASRSTTAAASFANSARRPARRERWRHPTIGPSACAAARISCGRKTRASPPSLAEKRAFRRSLHVRHVDAGSCNGCESELQGLNNPFYNLHRLGIFFTPSPRFADLLLVTGPVTHANARASAGGLRRHARAALGDGGRHLRRLGRNSRRKLCLRDRP